jgi:hypothetical protein
MGRVALPLVVTIRQALETYLCSGYSAHKMGNNDRATIIGKGHVHLKTANGTKLVLKSVRHVEALQLNIFSVGLLDEDGYSSIFEDGQLSGTKLRGPPNHQGNHPKECKIRLPPIPHGPAYAKSCGPPPSSATR